MASTSPSLTPAGQRRGQCWIASVKDVDFFADWDGSPAVSCHGPHQLYTFGVPALEGTHVPQEKLFGSKGYVNGSIESDAIQTCTNAQNAALGNTDDTVARIDTLPLLPDQSQWNAGARWVRCDVGVYAVGSPVSKPAFEDLPASDVLFRELKEAPSQFDLCVSVPDSSDPDGPDSAGALYVDCRDHPQWALHGYQYIVAGSVDDYPSLADMQAEYQTSCENPYSDATHITFAHYPTKYDWDDGDNRFECWIGEKPGT